MNVNIGNGNPSSKLDNITSYTYSNLKVLSFVEIVQFILLVIIIYKYNPFNISTTYPQYTDLAVLLVSFFYVMIFYFVKTKLSFGTGAADTTGMEPSEFDFLKKVGATVATFIGFVILTIALIWLINNYSILTTLVHHSLLILIILIGLGIIYLLSQPVATALKKSQSKTLSFLWNLLMFVPCLVYRFTDYIKEQNQLTTKPIWLLLGAEIVVIGLWILLPILYLAYSTHNGKQLLKEPVYLNEEHSLGTFEELHEPNINAKTGQRFKYHYSVSFWFYINPQPPNTGGAYNKYTNIFNYGNKPLVQYNGQKNSLIVKTENGKGDLEQIYENKNIIYQKWNNMVINYDGGIMDIFLNGELVSSKGNIAPYMKYENIKTGEAGGIQGGIANVNYFNAILHKNSIITNYKLLRDRKEPIM